MGYKLADVGEEHVQPDGSRMLYINYFYRVSPWHDWGVPRGVQVFKPPGGKNWMYHPFKFVGMAKEIEYYPSKHPLSKELNKCT